MRQLVYGCTREIWSYFNLMIYSNGDFGRLLESTSDPIGLTAC